MKRIATSMTFDIQSLELSERIRRERIESKGRKPVTIRFISPDDPQGDYTDVLIYSRNNLIRTLDDIRAAGYQAWIIPAQ